MTEELKEVSPGPTYVYIVTTGEYSDFTVLGVFSTVQAARKWMEDNPKAKDYTGFHPIERWELDKALDMGWPSEHPTKVQDGEEV